MKAENLWGEIPKTGHLRTPLAILREQAALLGDATNNVLQADVFMNRAAVFGPQFNIQLDIVAPALENYRYSVLQVLHGIEVYPLVVHSIINDTDYPCKDEESFRNALKVILSSNETHRVIDTLLSQSQAA